MFRLSERVGRVGPDNLAVDKLQTLRPHRQHAVRSKLGNVCVCVFLDCQVVPGAELVNDDAGYALQGGPGTRPNEVETKRRLACP